MPLWQHAASLHTPCTSEGGRGKEMQAQAPASSTFNQRIHKTQEAASRLLEKQKHLLKMLKNAGFADLKGRMAELFLSVSTVFAETICNRGVKKGGHMRCSPSAACYNDASPGDSVAFGWDVSPRTLSLIAYCRCQVPWLLLLLLLDICRVPAVHLVLIINSNKLPIFNSGLTAFPLLKICLFASSGTIFSKGKYAI